MSDRISYINSENWQTEVLESDRPVVVDFFSTECPPCDALAAKYVVEKLGDDKIEINWKD